MGELMEASNRQDGLLKIAPGLFGYDREIVKILRWLDAFFDSVGDAINAREILFPSLISLSTLNKIGYVDSFSDTLIYPSCYLPICKDIVKKKEGLKDVALTPAACFHIYPMYANNSFDAAPEPNGWIGDNPPPAGVHLDVLRRISSSGTEVVPVFWTGR